MSCSARPAERHPDQLLVCCQKASDVSAWTFRGEGRVVTTWSLCRTRRAVWHLYHEPIALLLLERGVKVSMGWQGRYLDNIFVEGLWRSVKYEEVYLKAYRNGSEARRGIDAYLDLYNRERPHQALGYRTPAQVFAEGRPLRCLPEQASTLSSREVVSDFPAGVSLNLASSLS